MNLKISDEGGAGFGKVGRILLERGMLAVVDSPHVVPVKRLSQ